jgi:uncharacterized lipoprotein YmbA
MKKILSFLCVLFLSGCVGTSPQSTFYMLKVPTGTKFPEKSLQILVDPVKIPAFLDKPQIVTLSSDGMQVHIAETKRWAEPLPGMIQRVMINDLANRLPNSQIRPKVFMRDYYDYVLYTDISKLDATFGKDVVLSVRWSLVDAQGKTVYKTQTTLSEKLGDSYDDLVKAESNLFKQLGYRIAKKLSAIEQ